MGLARPPSNRSFLHAHRATSICEASLDRAHGQEKVAFKAWPDARTHLHACLSYLGLHGHNARSTYSLSRAP
eukprot:6589956-Pyramimonas_sp.AAC.1